MGGTFLGQPAHYFEGVAGQKIYPASGGARQGQTFILTIHVNEP